MRGSNTAAGANGLSLATAFAFPYPYTAAAKLWFKITVVVGGTRSDASPIYGPVIMGALRPGHVGCMCGRTCLRRWCGRVQQVCRHAHTDARHACSALHMHECGPCIPHPVTHHRSPIHPSYAPAQAHP